MYNAIRWRRRNLKRPTYERSKPVELIRLAPFAIGVAIQVGKPGRLLVTRERT